MLEIGLCVTLRAKPGMEDEVRALLRQVLPDVQGEAGTPVWLAVEVDSSTFLIVDAHSSEQDRQAHLTGPVAQAIMSRADDLLIEPPAIQNAAVLAVKPDA